MPLVIGYYLEISHDLPAYGVEGECVSWRKEAVALFKKGKFDAEKALFNTSFRLEQLAKSPDDDGEPAKATEDVPEDADKEKKLHKDTKGKGKETAGKKRKRAEKQKTSENDPWGWDAKFKAYKRTHGPSLGGQKYDITKMSKQRRAAAAFDGKDPLAGISAKDLRENNLVLG